MDTIPKKVMLGQKQSSAKSTLDSKQLRQTQRLATQIKTGKLDSKRSNRHKDTTMQFKSPDPRVQYKPKRPTSQFKSLGSTKRSHISALAAQTKSPTLIAMPVRPRTIVKPPIIPLPSQTTIERPTMGLPVAVQAQTSIQPVQAVTQSPRVVFRVFAICLAATAVCVNFSNYDSLIPVLRNTLHIDDGQVGLFSTLLFLGIIASSVPGGIFADRFGSRRVILVALSLTTAGSLLLLIFPNFIWMVACCLLIGFGGGATMVSASHSTTASLAPALSRGAAYVQHFVLRFLLWCGRSIPFNYPRFLDYATERIFLRKVGGGYIFIHRLLLEYFASL